jgi:hypothetical protein
MAGFSGMDALIDDLNGLPDELKGEAANLIQAAANATEADVRQQYVRGKTGNLLNGVGQKSDGPLAVRVYSRAKHAHLYELGTVQRFQNNGKNTGTMPAKPVFIPAAIRARKRMMDGFERVLRRIKVRGMTGSAT